MSSDGEIMGWLGGNDPNKMEYHRKIMFLVFTAEVAPMSVLDFLPMVLPLPFNHSLSVGYTISGKVAGAQAIKSWNIFNDEGENSHQWIDTPFFHWWAEVVSLGGKQMALCWGQHGTYGMEPPNSQGPCPLRAAALSCYWKLWLEAMYKGFKGDAGQAWDKFTTLAMNIIPEDIRDNKDLLSMADLLALMYALPPERCYPNTLCSAFHLHFDFRDTKSNVEERTQRPTSTKAIAEAQQASPSRARDGRKITYEASLDGQMDTFLQSGFVSEEIQAPLASQGIIPKLHITGVRTEQSPSRTHSPTSRTVTVSTPPHRLPGLLLQRTSTKVR
jgi:hypothetical protein